MLGDEHRVPAVGRLLTVVGRLRCGQSAIDEIAGVRQNHREAPGFQIRTILLAKPEAASEARPRKPLEQRIEIIHQAARHQSSRPSPREQRERVSSEICTRPLSADSDREGRPMDHIVSVGMDADTLKQLDDLRRAHPNVPSRVQVIKSLIWEAHGKIAAAAKIAAE